MILLAALACAPTDDTTIDAEDCADGFERWEDGNCYVDGETPDDVEDTDGVTLDEFVEAYTDYECTFYLTCEEGWESFDACVEERAPRLASSLACGTWDAPLAELCLTSMEMLATEPCGTDVNTDACSRILRICTDPDY